MYYRARYYDAAVGKFLSEDPLGFLAGDANLSRYVANSPVNAVDPSGMAPPPAGAGAPSATGSSKWHKPGGSSRNNPSSGSGGGRGSANSQAGNPGRFGVNLLNGTAGGQVNGPSGTFGLQATNPGLGKQVAEIDKWLRDWDSYLTKFLTGDISGFVLETVSVV